MKNFARQLVRLWLLPTVCCLLLTAYCLLLPGCNVLSAIAYKTYGPMKIPAEYKPPQEPMLVLAESYHQSNDLQPYADQLTMLVELELTRNKVAPLVDQAKLTALRNQMGRDFENMKIPDVGRAVGAKQIMYIDLQECNFDSVAGSEMFRGSIKAKVRIVDVETSQTKWPSVSDGQPFAATTDYTRKEARDTPLAVRNMMLEDLAGAISRLFYDFKPNSEGGRGEPD